MSPLLRLVLENPLVAFVLVAWITGAIGGIAKKRKQQAAQSRPRSATPPDAGPRRVAWPPAQTQGRRSTEEVAAEMRRILGLDPGQETAAPPRPPRPPAPVPPSPPTAQTVTPARHLSLHGQSHVGEEMQHRQQPVSGMVGRRGSLTSLGTLGGRVHEAHDGATARRRLVALDDLKRVLVMNEILGKPLALRDR